MTKITITRIGIEKTIEYINKKTGKPDSFKKIGVLTNEYGDRWHDITFRGEVPVKVGQSYEVEISEREYNGKTYYDAKLPQTNRGSAGGLDTDTKALLQKIYQEAFAARQEVVMVRQLLQQADLIPSTAPVAKGVEYPVSSGDTAFDEPAPLANEFGEIDPADIPF